MVQYTNHRFGTPEYAAYWRQFVKDTEAPDPKDRPPLEKAHAMHPSTFEYLTPTPAQKITMSAMRVAAAAYGELLEKALPAGADKTYILRKFRELTMWVNVAITREDDGSPRTGKREVYRGSNYR